MEERANRQEERPPHFQRHIMDIANIRVREAFYRLRQFAAAGHDAAGLVDVGLVLREDVNNPAAVVGVGAAAAAVGVRVQPPQQLQQQVQQVAGAAANINNNNVNNPRLHEVDIQLRVFREEGDNPIPVPSRTPKVPKTELISGAIPIGTFLEVIVTKVISPSMFWVKLVGSVEELRTVERQMAVFYEDEHSPFRDPNFFIEEGAYSGGYYAFYSKSQRCWVRAICGYDGVLVTRNTSVSMYLLDHGKVEHVPATSIRPLQSSFCKLPAQGVMAAFVGESHDNAANRWTPETCLALRSQLQGRKLQVAVIRKCSIDFPCRFSRAEVVLKEAPGSSSVITAWNATESRFIKTPNITFSIPLR